MANFQVFFANEYQGANSEVLVIAQNVSFFQEVELGSNISRIIGLSSEHELTLFKEVAKASLKPTKENSSTAEIKFLTSDGLKNILVAVLPSGSSRHNTPSRSHAVTQIVKNNKRSVATTVLLIPGEKSNAFAQSIAVARAYSSFNMKGLSNPATPQQVDIVVHSSDGVDAEFLLGVRSVIGGIQLTQRLVDTPPNILHVDAYVAEATVVFSNFPEEQSQYCKMNVIQGRDLEAQGFGGLWGVGKASEHLPALVVLSYVPAGTEAEPSVCLVGKGIVYDTGGLSIKVPPGMATMKTDMGGSAAVLGAFDALVRVGGGSRPVHALLCIAENSVGPIATRPDDIHVLLSGKSVEINNTDAEGRLVLADGCFFASRDLNPAVIIDIATLTGAQLIATGRNHAAIYCNDDELEAVAMQVGKNTGDLTHPIPYCPEFYKQEFRSQVADMKNSVADRMNAQSSCAGQFIGNHIEDYLGRGGKWLHVDMAGPVTTGERATGYGVALLFGIVRALAQ